MFRNNTRRCAVALLHAVFLSVAAAGAENSAFQRIASENKAIAPSMGSRKIAPSGRGAGVVRQGPSDWHDAMEGRLSAAFEWTKRTWQVAEHDEAWTDRYRDSNVGEWTGRDADIESLFLGLRYAVTPDIGATLRVGMMKGGDTDINWDPGPGQYDFEGAWGLTIDANLLNWNQPNLQILGIFELSRGKTSDWRRSGPTFQGDIEEWRMRLVGRGSTPVVLGDLLYQAGLSYGQLLLPYTHDSSIPDLPREGGFESEDEIGFTLGGGMKFSNDISVLVELEGGASSGVKVSFTYDL